MAYADDGIDIVANLTRDPSRATGAVRYLSNALDLVVKVDGKVIDSSCILDIFQTPISDKPPRVIVFTRQANGKFELDSNGFPIKRTIEGEIEIQGTIQNRGCSSCKARNKRWWRRIEERTAGW